MSIRKLIEAYDEYIELFVRAESNLIGLAYTHGYMTPPELVERGEELRKEIAELKEALHYHPALTPTDRDAT